jgi:hypothetical protein
MELNSIFDFLILLNKLNASRGIVAITAGIAVVTIGSISIQSVGHTTVFISMSVIYILLGIYIWKLPREVL